MPTEFAKLLRCPRVQLPVQILLNFAIASLCNDFTLPGHGFSLEWLYSS